MHFNLWTNEFLTWCCSSSFKICTFGNLIFIQVFFLLLFLQFDKIVGILQIGKIISVRFSCLKIAFSLRLLAFSFQVKKNHAFSFCKNYFLHRKKFFSVHNQIVDEKLITIAKPQESCRWLSLSLSCSTAGRRWNKKKKRNSHLLCILNASI